MNDNDDRWSVDNLTIIEYLRYMETVDEMVVILKEDIDKEVFNKIMNNNEGAMYDRSNEW